MKCKNCGQRFTRNDSYCGECGEMLHQAEYRKKCQKKWIVFGIVFLFFSLALFSGIVIFSYLHSPKYIATTYFNALIDHDVEKIYSYMEDRESLFVSESLLKEKDQLQKNIEDVKIGRIYEEGDKTYVMFSYMLNGKNKISYVELKKRKIFNLLDTYKVVSGKVASNIEFVVPKNNVVTIDGKEISSYLQKDTTSEYDTYYIKDMIKGTYSITVTYANGLKVEKDVAIEDGQTYRVIDVELTEDEKRNIEDNSIASLNVLSKAALSRKDYDTISSNFKEDIESFYKQIKRSIQSKGIADLKYSDCEVRGAYIDNDGNVRVSLLVDYAYKDHLNEEKMKESSKMISLTYKYEGGTFILTN